MRAVRGSDHDWLYHLCVITHGSRWKFRGATPNPGEFEATMWAGVHAQFVVTEPDGRPAGLVGLYNTNLVANHSHLFAIAEPDRRGAVTDAAVELVTWAFGEFELAKIWIEVAEYNLEQFGSVTSLATVEARLTNHEYWRGRYWDLVIASITTSTWDDWRRRQRHVSVRTGDLEPETVAAIVAAHWPIDSLRAVELLDDLETLTGTPVDASVLTGCDPAEQSAYTATLHENLTRRR